MPLGNAERNRHTEHQERNNRKATQRKTILERKISSPVNGKKESGQRPSGGNQQQKEHEETMPIIREINKQQNKWKELKTQKGITTQHERQTEQEKDRKEQYTQELHKKEEGADKSEEAETEEEGGRIRHCIRSRTHPQQQIGAGEQDKKQQHKPSYKHYKETTQSITSHGDGEKMEPARKKQQQECGETPRPREIGKQQTKLETMTKQKETAEQHTHQTKRTGK